jgi:outer membrane receptor for ferrienterochelin and colicin
MLKHLLSIVFLQCIAALSVAQNSTISGRVTTQTGNEPVPFVPIVIQGTTIGGVTDDLGYYQINDVAPGLYNVECLAVGFKKSIVFEVEVTKDRPATVNFVLEELTLETGQVEIVASGISNQEESPVSIRTIGTNEIKRNPGGNRDISRVIRTLPGVAAIPSFRNDIIIRGGAANENRFYIDGIEIPNINHFATQGASGGPVGLINVDLINEVEFYSGAFPAARGNALSSVLEFGFKDARRDKYTANFIVGSSDIGMTVEGPTGPNSGIILSVRRSYLQGLFSLLQLPFLPTYNDYNLKWKWDINDKNKLTIVSLGALDDFALNLKLDDDTASENFSRNKYLLDNLVINHQWNYTFGAKWDHYREKSRITLVASRNMLRNEAFKHQQNNEDLPRTFDYASTEQENKLRLEHKLYGDKGWKILYGAGYEYAVYDNFSNLRDYNPFLDTIVDIKYRTDFTLNKYNFFFQSSKSLASNRLVLSAGVRADGNDFNEEMRNPLNHISPRFSLKYTFAPQWSINSNIGMYYQQPTYLSMGYQEGGVFVNKGIRYIRNQQAVLGIQYDWDKRNSIISVESFYKNYDRYPISVNRGISLANLGAEFGTVGNEALNSNGLGRAYGAEVLFQQKFYKGFYGILAYTWVRSEFTGADGNWTPSSWDSQHLLSVTGGKKFGKNWEIGGVFRFSGGLPYTPDNEDVSMQIANWDILRLAQVDWSQLNSKRIPAFHQLDIRIDKKWFFERWSLDLFLDIQNIYNNVTPVKPILDVQRDNLGNPIVDANNPSRYLPNYLDNSTGSVLPSIGIIVEL